MKLREAPPWLVLVAGWLIVIVFAFPGLMTQDSYDHLREARDRFYTDLHPPAMNLLWAISDYIVAGPFGILVVQNTCFLVGLHRIFKVTFAPRRAAWIAVAVHLFPPVLLPMAVIWKDSVMAGVTVLGVACLMRPERRTQLAGLAWLFVASCVRYNAFAATLPLIFFLFQWKPLVWWKRYPLAFGVWLAITVAAFGANRALTDRQMYFVDSSLAVFDIAGTLSNLDETLPDDELRRVLAGTEPQGDELHAKLRRLYSPRSFLPLVWPMKGPPVWNLPINGTEPAPEVQRDAIERAWKQVVMDHPRAYLAHRFAAYGELLGFSSEPSDAGFVPRKVMRPDLVGPYGLGLEASKLQRLLSRPMAALRDHSPLFTPWLYLVLALVLLPLAWRHVDLRALLASAVVFELALFPLIQSPDYRYSHWMVICTVCAVIVLVARRARNGGKADRVPAAT